MNVEEYFGMIISILMGLTFIALFLAFLYMMYGEKEESATPTKVKFFKNLSKSILLYLFKFRVVFLR